MKKFIVLIIGFCFSIFAQNIILEEPIMLLAEGEEQYLMPRISLDGKFVAFGGDNHKGVYLVDFDGVNMKKISNEYAAGWNIKWSPNSEGLVVRENIFTHGDKDRFSLLVYYDKAGNKKILTEALPEVEVPFWNLDGNFVLYLSKYQSSNGNTEFEVESSETFFNKERNYSYLVFNDDEILLSSNLWVPFQKIIGYNFEGKFINVELSPQKNKVAIEVAGKGLYIFDSVTEQMYSFGEGEAPCWINDDLLVYMKTDDDGSKILSSEIYIRKFDGSRVQNITLDFPYPAFYPSASRDGKIVFNSEAGKIYKLKLKI
jgi:Tol biopolymer transport system component